MITNELVSQAFKRAIAAGLKRGHFVACAFADPSGRTIGVLRHEEAQWIAPEFAVGKAILASAYKNRTQAMYDRLQEERPLYGTVVAGWAATNRWVLAEGGAAIMVGPSGKQKCIAAVGVAGCFPAATDQVIADEIVAWVKKQLAKK